MQFPLVLSWASEIKKVLGKTFQKIGVCFDLLKQQRFNSGQIYVALSCIISLNELYVLGKESRTVLKVDNKVTQQFGNTRKNYHFQRLDGNCEITEDSLILSFMNLRSMWKHINYALYEKILMKSDAILFYINTTIVHHEQIEFIWM